MMGARLEKYGVSRCIDMERAGIPAVTQGLGAGRNPVFIERHQGGRSERPMMRFLNRLIT